MRHSPSTDTYEIIPREEDTKATDFDVSADFTFLVDQLRIQAILMCAFCFYQLLGIYVWHKLLYLRFWVSRLNKCVLLYGLFLNFMMHYYRYREPGRLCAGDLLSSSEWQDEGTSSKFLLWQGSIFKSYLRVLYFLGVVAFLLCMFIIKQMLEIFA